MKLARTFATLSLLIVLALLSGGGSQGQPKGAPKSSAMALPKYWDQLGLSEDQRKEVIRLATEAQEKTAKLLEEIRKLEAERATKRVAVLTDEQKKKLVDLLAGSEPKGKTDTKAKEK